MAEGSVAQARAMAALTMAVLSMAALTIQRRMAPLHVHTCNMQHACICTHMRMYMHVHKMSQAALPPNVPAGGVLLLPNVAVDVQPLKDQPKAARDRRWMR